MAGKHVLSEKPVAENIKEAEDMIQWYRSNISEATWCIAENWRFLDSFARASEEIKKLGRLLGFQVRSFDMVQQSWKFYREFLHWIHRPSTDKTIETEWRKSPTHQGGFLLDGGVHFVAGIRQLLDSIPGNQITRVSAFGNMLQDYLPPIDTLNAIFKTKSGVSGTFQLSFGTTLHGNEWTVACENGVVSVNDSEISITANGDESKICVPNERTGVPPEVRAWGKALAEGKVLKEQEPEAALADLELVSHKTAFYYCDANSIFNLA